MKIAVITSYFNEKSAMLNRAHESVLAQTVPCNHFIVVDGGILRDPPLDAQIVYLSNNHNNYGDTPKWIGAISALSQGYDAIAFLDADDWLSPEHIENCLNAIKKSDSKICITNRQLHRPDGTVIDVHEGMDIHQSHCVLIMAEAARKLLSLSIKPNAMCEIGDRIMWAAIREKKIPYAFEPNQTYHYTTTWRVHYEAINETLPDGSKKSCGNKFQDWLKISSQAIKDYWSELLIGKNTFF